MTAACVSAAPVRRARADRDGRGQMTFVLAASVGEVLLRIVMAVAVAIVTTIIALRLLGGRRGWVTALLAGAAGWTLAALLTLGLNDWDWGADGLLIRWWPSAWWPRWRPPSPSTSCAPGSLAASRSPPHP